MRDKNVFHLVASQDLFRTTNQVTHVIDGCGFITGQVTITLNCQEPEDIQLRPKSAAEYLARTLSVFVSCQFANVGRQIHIK